MRSDYLAPVSKTLQARSPSLYAEAKENDFRTSAEEQEIAAARGGVVDNQNLESINDRS
jgi:hypothetical protein